MKRKLTILLIACLLLAMLSGTVQGADLAFVAVDEAIPITLSGSEAPYYARGTLYVPHTAFQPSALQVVSSYNADSGTLILYSRDRRLTFDLNAGTMTTETGELTHVTCYVENGVVFLPVGLCAPHFDFQVSLLTSLNGYPILRFTTAAKVYDDKDFIRYAENLISYRVNQYEMEHANSETQPPDSGTSQPPISNPGTTDQSSTPEDPDPTTVYLILIDASTMEDALKIVEAEDLPAAFFFAEWEIPLYANLIRQLQAKGYPVGITASEGSPDLLQELENANSQMELVCKSRSMLALVPAGSGPVPGYAVFPLPSSRLTATEVVNSVKPSHLMYCTGENLTAVLQILQATHITFAPLRETTQLS